MLAKEEVTNLLRHNHILHPADTATAMDELVLHHQGGRADHLPRVGVLDDGDKVGALHGEHPVEPLLPLLLRNLPHGGQLAEQGQKATVKVSKRQRPHQQAVSRSLNADWRVEGCWTHGQIQAVEKLSIKEFHLSITLVLLIHPGFRWTLICAHLASEIRAVSIVWKILFSGSLTKEIPTFQNGHNMGLAYHLLTI